MLSWMPPTGGATVVAGTSVVTISNSASVPSLSVADINVNQARRWLNDSGLHSRHALGSVHAAGDGHLRHR